MSQTTETAMSHFTSLLAHVFALPGNKIEFLNQRSNTSIALDEEDFARRSPDAEDMSLVGADIAREGFYWFGVEELQFAAASLHAVGCYGGIGLGPRGAVEEILVLAEG
jgi:hypothetical protein